MRAIFLADAHLVAANDDNYRQLIRFLRTLEGTADALYIMGDLFDFWIGFPSNPFSEHEVLLSALERLVHSGCRLIYFEGNHDFHLGSIFSQRLKAEIHSGPQIVEIQGRHLYLCHGDQLNPADYGYRLLRFVLHNKAAAAAVKIIPPALAIKIKELLQRSSRSTYQAKSARWDYRQILRTAASSVRQQGCDGLVAGHFHLACCEKLEPLPATPAFTILALGDWLGQFTYGELRDGELKLLTYSD